MKNLYRACALLLAWHTLALADSSEGSASTQTALESIAQEVESSVQDSSQDSTQVQMASSHRKNMAQISMKIRAALAA